MEDGGQRFLSGLGFDDVEVVEGGAGGDGRVESRRRVFEDGGLRGAVEHRRQVLVAVLDETRRFKGVNLAVRIVDAV